MATILKQQVDDRVIPADAPEAPDAPKGGKRRFVLPIFLVLVALGGVWAFKK